MERKVRFKTPELQAVYDEVRDYFIRNKFKIAHVEQVKGKPCLVVYERYRLWEEAPGEVRWDRVVRNAGEREHWTWELDRVNGGARVYLSPTDLSYEVYTMAYDAIHLACKKLGLDWTTLIKKPLVAKEATKLAMICEHGLVFGYRVNHLWAAKYLTKLLWGQVLNKEALALASKLHARAKDVHFNSYSFVRKNQTVLTQLAAEAPNLMPMLRHFDWGATPLSLEAFGQVRKDKLSCGVTPAMWRWLSKQTLTVVNKMFEDQRLWALLAATGEQAPYSVVSGLARGRLLEVLPSTELEVFGSYGTQTPEYLENRDKTWNNLILFTRLALREARNRKGRLKAFVNTEMMLAADWIRSEYSLTPYESRSSKTVKRLPGNMTWSGVLRGQQEWHEDVALRAPSGPNKSWESLIPAQSLEGFEVKPLLSTAELVQEGRLLHHCVGGYADTCESGQSRVFAVSGAKDRATLELSRHGDKWRVAQVRSYCNSGVSKAAADLAKKVAARYQAAWKKHLEVAGHAQSSASEGFSQKLRMAA